MVTLTGTSDADTLTGEDNGGIVRVSQGLLGKAANGYSRSASLSPDGTKVVFQSDASNLVSGDLNRHADIFVADLATGTITMVSTSSSGVHGDGDGIDPIFAPDGSAVIFADGSENLDPSAPEGGIFKKDLASGVLTYLSTDALGNPLRGGDPAVSQDGTKLAFLCNVDGLVQVLVKDLVTGEITVASSDSAGNPGDHGNSGPLSFSPDGSKIAFGDYVKDLTTGALVKFDTNINGDPANQGSWGPAFLPDGERVAFASNADNLVAGDANGLSDIFIKNLVTGEVDLVSTNSEGMQGYVGGPPFVSGDGTLIAFDSSYPFVVGDNNNLSDIFVKDLTNGWVHRVSNNAQSEQYKSGGANIFGVSIDGTKVVFVGSADNLAPGSTKYLDIYVKDITYDTIHGAGGDDTIFGKLGDDRLYGDGGDDLINGGVGNDTLYGDIGQDTLVGGLGDDILDGGGGQDTASYVDAASWVKVDLTKTADTKGAGIDVFVSIENLVGSAFDDILKGDAGANRLEGGAGNDNLGGQGGDDLLIGGGGDDILRGADGSDTASYENAAVGVTVSLAIKGGQDTGGEGVDDLGSIENLIGSGLGDHLTGSTTANTLTGGDGDDVLTGAGGGDVLIGGLGADSFVFTALKDSTSGLKGQDQVMDFSHAEGDLIDLMAIDADTTQAGDDPFTLAAAFTHQAGQLIQTAQAGGYLVQGDVDGNGNADFALFVHSATVLVTADFML